MIINIIKYIFSGGTSFLINILIFWILTKTTNIWYVYASVISFILSTFVGYNLHKKITYIDRSKTEIKTVFVYYILNIINISMNAFLIFIFVEYLNIFKLISLILSNTLISIYSFIIYKKIIFNK